MSVWGSSCIDAVRCLHLTIAFHMHPLHQPEHARTVSVGQLKAFQRTMTSYTEFEKPALSDAEYISPRQPEETFDVCFAQILKCVVRYSFRQTHVEDAFPGR